MDTFCHPIFTNLEKEWYKRDTYGNYIFNDRGQRIKQIPRDFILNERRFSIWFFDDGCNDLKRRRIDLHTECFSEYECHKLCDMLKNFGLTNCEVYRRYKGKSQFVIRIKSASYCNAIAILEKYSCDPCMSYKLVSRQPNYSTRFQPKLSLEQRKEAIRLYTVMGLTYVAIAKKFNVTDGAIQWIVKHQK